MICCKMKWRGTLVIWILLFAPLSIYNIFGSPIFFPNHSTQYRDPKTLHYNFSMASPVFVAGNFSVGFLLDKAPSYYRVSAYVNVAEDYMSFGAYGVFHLIANISENGFYSSNRGLSSRFDNVLPPPCSSDRLRIGRLWDIAPKYKPHSLHSSTTGFKLHLSEFHLRFFP